MTNKLQQITGKARRLAIMLTAILLTHAIHAQVVTLQDGNSSAVVNVNSSAGMSQWLVDGINNLNQQWFWYRVGSGAQSPINSISAAAYTQSAANTLDTTYNNGSYSVEINYTLTGGGTGTADIGEGITIKNMTAATLNFHFYQYSDFNLLNTPGGDTILMNNSQWYQYKGPSQIAETIVSPPANEFEANLTGGPNSTLNKLNNQNNLTLNNNSQSGPGDVTGTLQWDLSIPANSSIDITKDKLIDIAVTPEPPSSMVTVLGFAVLFLSRRMMVYWKNKRSH